MGDEMSKFFTISKDWSFVDAFENINAHYGPGSMMTGAARNVQIENWGVMIGRTRALAEVNSAIDLYKSKAKLAKHIKMSPPTLNRLIKLFESLPDDTQNKKALQGMTISGFFLLAQIGNGGNSDVWRVRDSDKKIYAMKILRRAKGKSLIRFDDEIHILEKIKLKRNIKINVLPVIKKYSDLSADKYAWYTMPIANPLKKHINSYQPKIYELLFGLITLADTLVELHKDNIYHRDIKPDNIFLLDRKWHLGDFGIASFDGKESITKEGCKLGSQHYYAPEMLSNADKSSGELADVYSFAKTMWVLLSGQTYPPAGELRIDTPQLLLSSYCDFKGIDRIDQLISKCTATDPLKRPKIADMRLQLQEVVNMQLN